jgi:hypothetical protein
MNKRASLLLIVILTLSSLIMIESAFAQSIPKPSVPEFTVQIVAYPYDVPTTHSIDPFTGKDVTHEGYHVENRSIEVRIKNQPFTPYQIQDSNGNNWTINLYYNIRIKGHFSEDWIEIYRGDHGYPYQYGKADVVLSYVLGEGDAYTDLGTISMKFPAGGQVDFQVEAMIGYIHHVAAMPFSADVFEGETSGWSNTQTVTIPTSTSSPNPSPSVSLNPSPSPSPSPEPTPEVEPFPTTLVIASIGSVAIVGLGLLVYLKKRQKGSVDKRIKLES